MEGATEKLGRCSEYQVLQGFAWGCFLGAFQLITISDRGFNAFSIWRLLNLNLLYWDVYLSNWDVLQAFYRCFEDLWNPRKLACVGVTGAGFHATSPSGGGVHRARPVPQWRS